MTPPHSPGRGDHLVSLEYIWSQSSNVWSHTFGGTSKLLRWHWWRRRGRPGMQSLLWLLICAALLQLHAAAALRCYTTKDASKARVAVTVTYIRTSAQGSLCMTAQISS